MDHKPNYYLTKEIGNRADTTMSVIHRGHVIHHVISHEAMALLTQGSRPPSVELKLIADEATREIDRQLTLDEKATP